MTPLTAYTATISRSRAHTTGKITPQGKAVKGDPARIAVNACPYCLAEIKPGKRGRRFCTPRHRLLYWAAGEIVKEYQAGRAEGLKVLIKRLSGQG